MADPTMVEEIKEAVTIPVMAKARIGHFVEAQVLEALEVDYIDESEVLTPADEAQPHRQVEFKVPVRVRRHRPRRGAAADRRGRGHDPHQGRGRHRQRRRGGAPHARRSAGEIRRLASLDEAELPTRREGAAARRSSSSARWPSRAGCRSSSSRAGGIATPADAALMMQLGAEGEFVGSGIFKSEDPARTRAAIVEATTHFKDPERVAAASRDWASRWPGIEIGTLEATGGAAPDRGW